MEKPTSDAVPWSLSDEPLRFEHLVQINDPSDPRIIDLTRMQLWRGLVIRAERPSLFLPWLDEADILSQPDGSLERRLRFGGYHVRDRVRFFNREIILYEILESGQGGRFSLTMQIEEPSPGELFVRFTYLAHSADHHAQSPLGDYVKSAYRLADRDTIFRIRQFADTGALDDD